MDGLDGIEGSGGEETGDGLTGLLSSLARERNNMYTMTSSSQN